MHILIIPSEEFIPDNIPTAGIFQYHQASVLKEAGHKVGVISIKQSYSIPMVLKALVFKMLRKKTGNASDEHSFTSLIALGCKKLFKPACFIQIEKRGGIDVIHIDGFYFMPPIENENHFGWIKAGIAAYKKYVDLFGKPDVIHAHNAIYAGMLGQRILEEFGIPYVITEHSTVFARKLITKKTVIERVKKAYSKSSSLMAVSQPFCELLNNSFSTNRFLCLPNVLDPDFEKKHLTELRKSNDFIFANIAELHPKKDHRTLILAFKKVYELHKNARLWIGGEGVLGEELKKLVEYENMSKAIHFLGQLNREEVIHCLEASDCFVLSSKYETFGVVVIESMLFGKPVIVTRCGGPESFVNADVGIVIEKENENELANAMLGMINNHSNFNKHNIRQFALENFGTEVFCKRVTKIYKETMRSKDGYVAKFQELPV